MLVNHVCGHNWLGLAAEDVKYNNPVVKLAHYNGKYMYPVFQSGFSLYPDELPKFMKDQKWKWEVVEIPDFIIVRQVKIYFDSQYSWFKGLEMFNEQGDSLLKTVDDIWKSKSYVSFHIVTIGEGERLVGLRCGQSGDSQKDVTLIIGRQAKL